MEPRAFQPIDDGALLNQLPVWAPEPGVRKKILVGNPARLYQFLYIRSLPQAPPP